MFEVTIRALGGLNSAYALSGDELWLRKAIELGDALLPAFALTRTGCPPREVTLATMGASVDVEETNPAEAGTLQLEFRTLSVYTGDAKYAKAVDVCMERLVDGMGGGIVTDRFLLRDGRFWGERVSVGAMVDSFYEMLLKSWVGFGKRDEGLRKGYVNAVDGILKKLVKKGGGGVTYVGERIGGGDIGDDMEHLTCFFPGNLAYGALHGLGGGIEGEYLKAARDIMKGCYEMSRVGFHGVAGEVSRFSGKKVEMIDGLDYNLLRPEIVESLFYLDRIDEKFGGIEGIYRKWGENMWKGIKEYAQIEGKEKGIIGSIYNLSKNDKNDLYHKGKLHSFAFSETFKYFYLLFDQSQQHVFPLTEWVYNTEAHPVKIRK